MLLAVGVVLGVHIRYLYLAWLPVALLMAVLFAAMMGGFGLLVGLTTSNTQLTFLVINFFTLPLMFIRPAMLPAALLPHWLQSVTRVNPVTYAVDGIHVIITGRNASQIAHGTTVASVVGAAPPCCWCWPRSRSARPRSASIARWQRGRGRCSAHDGMADVSGAIGANGARPATANRA